MCSVSGWLHGLGQAEVDDLGDGLAVVEADEDVRGLQVAVDDALLMGVLDGLANRDEELEPLLDREADVVAVLGDRHAFDVFHDEVRPAFVGHAAVKDLGDVGMVHQGEGLPLGLEPREDLARVHARLDELEGDAALDRLGLLGDPDGAHAAFADLLQQLVAADFLAGALGCRLFDRGDRSRGDFDRAAGLLVVVFHDEARRALRVDVV